MRERIAWREEVRRGPNRTDPEGWYFGDFFVGSGDKAVDKELGTDNWYPGMQVDVTSGEWRLVDEDEPDASGDEEPSPYASLPPDGDYTLWYRDPATGVMTIQRRFKGSGSAPAMAKHVNKIPPTTQRHWWVRKPDGTWCGTELFWEAVDVD